MVVAGIKTLAEVRIGDTLTDARSAATEPLPGFQDREADGLQRALSGGGRGLRGPQGRAREAPAERRSLVYEPETSAALGFGFRCGFLGFLHSEIVQERLEREYDLDLITTAPTVRYRVVLRNSARSARSRAPARCRTRPTSSASRSR